jgi:hypothetical protein
MKRRTLFKSLAVALTAAVALAPSGLFAATAGGSYQVEIIVFQALNPAGGEDLSAPA